MHPYHSALRDEQDIERSLDYFSIDGSVVFRHNVVEGVHSLYKNADVVYTELAWRKGYNEFIKRATGKEDSSSDYKGYLLSVKHIIDELGLPTYAIVGKHMLKHICPEKTMPIKLFGDAILGIWKAEINQGWINHHDVIEHIAKNYDMALDFNCGYGNMALAMHNARKNFICSDINGKCVYYIAKSLMGYEDVKR